MGAGDGAIFTRHSVEVGEHTIPYLKGGPPGDQEPVLVLHGLGGAGKWESFHMALGTVRETLLPQLPGWQTGDVPDEMASFKDYAGIARGFLDAVGIDRAVLVGHSSGGWIAQYLVTQAPERVAGLVLIGAMGLDVAEAPTADLSALDQEEFARRAFARLGTVATANPYGFGAEWQKVQGGPEFERQWKGRNLVAKLANGTYADTELASQMAAVRVPTLLLWGRRDSIVPLQHGELLRRLIPGSRLRVLERAAHLPMAERNETTNRLVRNFLLDIEEEIPEVTTVE